VRLVDDLLDVSRITRGKIRLQMELVDVANVVATAVETSRPLIEEHRHELTTQLPDFPVFVNADPARLAQILSNLLNNAAKYTLDGGKILLSVAREGDEAVIRVRDTGSGIPKELLTKVFDLFTQVDRSLDRSQGGLGIGLTLVRRLVDMHGGNVHAFSDGLGEGSEFVVRLPAMDVKRQPLSEAKRSENSGSLVGERLRILIVDDNVDAADSLAMLLRMTGHELQLAHNGPAAVEVAREFRPEVALLDIGLPGLNGCEVAIRLRADPNTRDCLLIAVSGYGQEEDRQRSFESGFNLHLTKPVDFAVLEKALASFLQKDHRGKQSGCALVN
jgi:CheY-like chemotaxis protein/two-component sensor histidine kinase